jgi:hypothetical protein
MAHARSAIALEAFGRLHARTPPGCAARVDPRLFGRGRMRILDRREEQSWSIPDDVKLFATTFAAGFLFVSILIA